MPIKKQICRNCLYYRAYYTKGVVSFRLKYCGNCEKFHKQIDDEEVCENWKDNSELKIKREKLCKENLIYALKNIVEIINLLKTDFDEETPEF